MRLISQKSIRAQYAKVKAALLKAEGEERANLYGAMQALAWCLDDHAMNPVKAFKPRKKVTPEDPAREP